MNLIWFPTSQLAAADAIALITIAAMPSDTTLIGKPAAGSACEEVVTLITMP